MRKLEKKETLGFRNSKNKQDLINFLSEFNGNIFRVDTTNKTTGEGTYDLYECKLSDSFDVAFEIGIKPIHVERLKA
jgi:hypothetical protein